MRVDRLQAHPRLEDALLAIQRRRKLRLQFPEQTELAFIEARARERALHYRHALLIALLIYDLFIVLEAIFMPDRLAFCVLLKLGIVTPLSLLTLLAVTRITLKLRELLYAVALLPMAISVPVLYVHPNTQTLCGQTGLVLVLFYAIAGLRPSFCYSSVIVPVWALADALFLWLHSGLPFDLIIFSASLIFAAGVIALLVAYWMERQERIGYLLALHNEAQNQELALINTELERLSLVDPLTGIANRRHFDAEFHSVWEHCQRRHLPLAALMIDLDHFKALNDRFGHVYGDNVLCCIAHAIRDALRGEHDLVARYGGEEFAALLPGQRLEDAIRIGERLRSAIQAVVLPPTLEEEMPDQATISVGVASLQPGPANCAANLLRAADAALYEAKSQGRNCVCAAPAEC